MTDVLLSLDLAWYAADLRNCKTERDGTRVVGRGGAAGWIKERSPSVMIMMRVLEVGRFLNVKTHELRLHLQGAR